MATARAYLTAISHAMPLARSIVTPVHAAGAGKTQVKLAAKHDCGLPCLAIEWMGDGSKIFCAYGPRPLRVIGERACAFGERESARIPFCAHDDEPDACRRTGPTVQCYDLASSAWTQV